MDEFRKYEEKRVISVKVIHPGYLVSYEGRYYEHVGNTTREMDTGKLQALLLRGKPWDSLTSDISIAEIDADTVKHFTQLAVDSKRLTDVSLNDPYEVVLKKLGFIIDGKIINKEYQEVCTISNRTATRDLMDLVRKTIENAPQTPHNSMD